MRLPTPWIWSSRLQPPNSTRPSKSTSSSALTPDTLTSFIGVVDMLDIEKNKVRVIVSMFGRETPVELELDQVELVSE